MKSCLSRLDEAYAAHLEYLPRDKYAVHFAWSIAFSQIRTGAREGLFGFLVGPPGCGKTETVLPIKRTARTHNLSTLTPKSLLSGYRPDDDPSRDPSLLPQLDGKCLTIDDMCEIQTHSVRDRKKIFSDLRFAFGGEADAKFGNIKETQVYKVQMSLLGCATESLDSVLSEDQELGQRAVIFRMSRTVPRESVLAQTRRALVSRSQKDLRRKTLDETCQAIASDIETAYRAAENEEIKIPDNLLGKIVDLADFVATVRSMPTHDGFASATVSPERGTRLVQQLANLGEARIILDGRRSWTDSDLRFIAMIARDTLPPTLLRLLTALYRDPVACGEPVAMSALLAMTGLPPDSLLQIGRQWASAGIVSCSQSTTGHQYCLTPSEADRLTSCGFFLEDLP